MTVKQLKILCCVISTSVQLHVQHTARWIIQYCIMMIVCLCCYTYEEVSISRYIIYHSNTVLVYSTCTWYYHTVYRNRSDLWCHTHTASKFDRLEQNLNMRLAQHFWILTIICICTCYYIHSFTLHLYLPTTVLYCITQHTDDILIFYANTAHCTQIQ